ncbi:MAG: hypothetical protein ACK40G_00500 [Cytophagaceae bacterium]
MNVILKYITRLFKKKLPPDYTDILELDWGAITPDYYDKSTNTVVHVCNFEMRSGDKRLRAIKFIIGRVYWFNKHLPQNVSHKIVCDVRGQELETEISLIEKAISVGIIQTSRDIKFIVEFKI